MVSPPLSSRDRWITLCLFLSLFFCYLFTASPINPTFGDSREMLRDAQRILHHGFALLPNETRPAFSRYGLGQPLLNITVVWIFDTVDMADPFSRAIALLVISSLPAACSALAATLVFSVGRQLGYDPFPSALAALLCGLTTMTWVYAQSMFSDVTIGLAWIITLYALLKAHSKHQAQWYLAAGAATGFAILCKSTAIVGFPLFGLFLLLQSPRDRSHKTPATQMLLRLALFGIPVLTCLFLTLWYNSLRYGNCLLTGYTAGRDATGFYTPLAVGLFGLLLSSGKGFFFYNPTFLLLFAAWPAFFRHHKNAAILIATLATAIILVYARWWAWHGDISYGPRFLSGLPPLLSVILIPYLAQPDTSPSQHRVHRLWRNSRILLLAFLGFTVQISGLLIEPSRFFVIAAPGTHIFGGGLYDPQSFPLVDDGIHLHFIPQFSPLIGHWWMIRCIWLSQDPQSFNIATANPPWISLNSHWLIDANQAGPNLFFINLWWVIALHKNIPHPAIIKLIATSLAAAAVICLVITLQLASRPVRLSPTAEPPYE